MTMITTKTTASASTDPTAPSTAAARAPIVLTPDQIASVAGGLKPSGGRATTGYVPPRNLGR